MGGSWFCGGCFTEFDAGVVLTPTNVGQKSASVSRTWLTMWTRALLHTMGKCPSLLHSLHSISAAGQFLLPGGY